MWGVHPSALDFQHAESGHGTCPLVLCPVVRQLFMLRQGTTTERCIGVKQEKQPYANPKDRKCTPDEDTTLWFILPVCVCVCCQECVL